MRQLIIGPNDSGQRIDKFMGKRFKNMPTALIYKFIRKKCVSVNKKKVPEKFESLVHGIGFALLLLLMLVVTFNDILTLIKN